MGKKIVLTGFSSIGKSDFKFLDAESAIKQLSGISGLLRVEITPIDVEGTDAQLWHFKNEVVSECIELSRQGGQILSEKKAIGILLRECGFSTSLSDLNKTQLSELIDKSKAWMIDFFNIKSKKLS